MGSLDGLERFLCAEFVGDTKDGLNDRERLAQFAFQKLRSKRVRGFCIWDGEGL